jgi:hypothetical protein
MREFDDVYAKYFHGMLPARTTIQQIASAERNSDKEGRYPDLEQVSFIAVRNGPGHYVTRIQPRAAFINASAKAMLPRGDVAQGQIPQPSKLAPAQRPN